MKTQDDRIVRLDVALSRNTGDRLTITDKYVGGTCVAATGFLDRSAQIHEASRELCVFPPKDFYPVAFARKPGLAQQLMYLSAGRSAERVNPGLHLCSRGKWAATASSGAASGQPTNGQYGNEPTHTAHSSASADFSAQYG